MADSAIWLLAQAPSRMATINISVMGSLGVGKSSFIQKALRLSKRPTLRKSSVGQDVEGVPTIVCLLEHDLGYLETVDMITQGKQIQWPKQIDGQPVPRLDGALVLYDVTNSDSIRNLPTALSEPRKPCAFFSLICQASIGGGGRVR